MFAKIYRPAKTAMQSGKAGTQSWVLELAPAPGARPDMLMGWVGSADALGQVRLRFDTKEAAIAFAREHGLAHQVFEPIEPRRATKSYSDNFAYSRREPWSH